MPDMLVTIATSFVTTLVILTVVAALNTAYNARGPFHGLQYLTHWWLLLAATSFVFQEPWWVALTSTTGLLVLLLHWSLVALGSRAPPRGDKTTQNLLCYLALPVIMIVRAMRCKAYSAPLSRSLPGLAALVCVYTAVVCAHDARHPETPAYPSLPASLPVLNLAALGVGAGWLVLMHHRKAAKGGAASA